ncbi:MAG: aminotransferase class I/II-fold pyridoxal phosphate-dependent enzyme, partial [Actinomycetota bacterium]
MRDPLGFVAEELRRLAQESLLREVHALDSAQEPEVTSDGARLILLASNNYLGLATDPRVTGAAAEAALRWGAGTGSARLISGAMRLHDELESHLAAFKVAQAALLFSSGYLANLGTISALAGRGDAVFSDALNHASIVDGARLSRADVHVYRHADAGHLADLLRTHRSAARRLVVTDTIFSMDGDLAPLPEIVAVCEREDAILMVDEAHATGVVGPGGRGAVAHFGLEGRVPIVMGTLSKALGAAGGYIAGSHDLIAFLRNRARAFIFDTAPPPPAVGAAAAALDVVEREPQRVERARELAFRLAQGLRASGYAVPDPAAAIVPVVVGAADAALALSRSLRAGGVLV